MDSITLKAPAKVNLFLDVLRKRSDGYHDIITVFEKIDLCDKITISVKEHQGVSIFCNGDIPQKENLVYKAACLILSKTRVKCGLDIKINKKIPIAAGLGGGSSDAAATLVGINKLLKLKLTKDNLIKLARYIGADAPFFILDSPFAIGRNRGDSVEGLFFRHLKMWHLVIFPGVKKFARDVYGALRLGLTKPSCNVKMLLHALKIGDLNLVKEAAYNRLEDPALDRDPGLSTIKSNLIRLGMESALLAGSGPAIFSIMKTRKEAVLLKERVLRATGVKTEGWQVFVVRTL